MRELITDKFRGGLYRTHFYLYGKVEVCHGPDEYNELSDDFETLADVYIKYSDGRDCAFGLRIRDTALCALRRKQEEQKRTVLPMLPALVALLDESQPSQRCTCQNAPMIGGGEADHRDVFDESPDHATTVDSFREQSASPLWCPHQRLLPQQSSFRRCPRNDRRDRRFIQRQIFLRKLHERGENCPCGARQPTHYSNFTYVICRGLAGMLAGFWPADGRLLAGCWPVGLEYFA